MFAVALIVAAGCLRAPFTCVGPLADVIQADLGVSSGGMGMVTAVPLLMFAAFSAAFGALGRSRVGGRVMLLGLMMILSGVVCRSLLGTWGLFLGTAVMGIGITAGNVLIPAFIKARFPERIGRLTGLYTAMLSAMSAVAGAVSVPLGDAVGWRGSLLVWAVLIMAAVLLWLPHRDTRLDDGTTEPGEGGRILRSRTTWLVAMYLGLQSLVYYAMVAWLSVVLQSKGLTPAEAGMANSAYMVLGIAGSLLLPALAGGRRDLRALGAAMGAVYTIGVASLILCDGSALALPLVLCGLCGGSCITFATMLFGLRTETPGDSSAMSGIAQSIGYLVAAAGPVTVGAAFDATSDWDAGLAVLLAVTASLIALGYLVGRDTAREAPAPEA